MSHLHRNPPEPHQPSAPKLSGTSSAICTGTLRNFISHLHWNPPEPTGTLRNLLRNLVLQLHRIAPELFWAKDPIASFAVGEKTHTKEVDSLPLTRVWVCVYLSRSKASKAIFGGTSGTHTITTAGTMHSSAMSQVQMSGSLEVRIDGDTRWEWEVDFRWGTTVVIVIELCCSHCFVCPAQGDPCPVKCKLNSANRVEATKKENDSKNNCLNKRWKWQRDENVRKNHLKNRSKMGEMPRSLIINFHQAVDFLIRWFSCGNIILWHQDCTDRSLSKVWNHSNTTYCKSVSRLQDLSWIFLPCNILLNDACWVLLDKDLQILRQAIEETGDCHCPCCPCCHLIWNWVSRICLLVGTRNTKHTLYSLVSGHMLKG